MDLSKFVEKQLMGPIQVINQRYSVRDYLKYSVVNPEKEDILLQYVSTIKEGPFGSQIFIINVPKPMSTYKFISFDSPNTDPPHFLVGGILTNIEEKNCIGFIDFGYCFEKAILAATSLNLGTCWIAGSFHAKEAERYIKLSQEHKTLCITPYGVAKPRSKISCIRRCLFRCFLGRRARVQLRSIFFINNFKTPFNFKNMPTELHKLQERINNPNAIQTIMENVRWAPSARNAQEWRIVYNQADGTFNFYSSLMSKVMRYIDIGIAMCHFELASNELHLTGKWYIDSKVQNAKLPGESIFARYHFSWKFD